MRKIKKCGICRRCFRGTVVAKYCPECRPERARRAAKEWYHAHKPAMKKTSFKDARIEEVFEILKNKLFEEKEKSETAVVVERKDLEELTKKLGDIVHNATLASLKISHLLEPPIAKEDGKPVVINEKTEFGD